MLLFGLWYTATVLTPESRGDQLAPSYTNTWHLTCAIGVSAIDGEKKPSQNFSFVFSSLSLVTFPP
jgi:hypothetical protein